MLPQCARCSRGALPQRGIPLRRLRHADHRRLGPYKGENKCPVGGDYHGLDWARAIIYADDGLTIHW